MPVEHHRLNHLLARLLRSGDLDTLRAKLRPRFGDVPARVPGGASVSPEALERRWSLLGKDESRAELADARTVEQAERYARNIEHFVGTVKVPVGIAGPLRVNGLFAQGDYYVPLATTEAALVASYSRGAALVTEAGGCASILLNEGVGRSPAFAFRSLEEAGLFVGWAAGQMDAFREAAEGTTRHGKLLDMRVAVEGSHVYLHFDFFTADASGQNMVTIACEAICRYIELSSPVRPQYCYVEGNFSGDKKASALSFLGVRGRKVSAEVVLPPDLLSKRLRTTPAAMVDYWRMAAIGGVMSGTMGVQGHYANGIAALYIACGQDAACVAESAIGVTRFEVTPEGALYASVTLPNLMLGTVGGGTGLPSQRACLELLGLAGPGKAQALAEVCAGLCLAGELSIIGALCSGDFARAHQRLARGRERSS